MNTIAERLLLVRGKIKQGEFAALLDVNPNTLRSYENGRSCPNQEFLERICVQFSVSAEWLLLGRGSMRAGETRSEHTEQSQLVETASAISCARCALLEEELTEERKERRELGAELREVNAENRRLAKENTELIRENAELRKRKADEQASLFDERRHIPSSDDVLQNRPTICK